MFDDYCMNMYTMIIYTNLSKTSMLPWHFGPFHVVIKHLKSKVFANSLISFNRKFHVCVSYLNVFLPYVTFQSLVDHFHIAEDTLTSYIAL